MSGHDAELDQFGPGVSCAVLLERATPPWQLDRKGSARRALGARALSRTILLAASEADAVRDGAYGSAWFAHRDPACQICHIEVRGPDFKGSLRGGTKTLFRLAGGPLYQSLLIPTHKGFPDAGRI